MRTLGSALDSPRSRTCPRTWPLAFCDLAVPRWHPRPRKAAACSRRVHEETGSPFKTENPRPECSSQSNRCSFAPSVGSGKMEGVKAVISWFRSRTEAVASSIS
eukprot:1017700-Rhodomonas_salina.1